MSAEFTAFVDIDRHNKPFSDGMADRHVALADEYQLGHLFGTDGFGLGTTRMKPAWKGLGFSGWNGSQYVKAPKPVCIVRTKE